MTKANSLNVSTAGAVSFNGTVFTGGTLAFGSGGTGQTAYTDGQLLIGDTSSGGITKATLTAGTNIAITNGNGTISAAIAYPLVSSLVQGEKLKVSALGTLTTGTTTINLASAQVFTCTITSSNTITFDFSNAPAAGESEVVIIRMSNGGAGTIVWPAGTQFASSTAPTLTAGGLDMLGVYYDVTTTTYIVFVIGLNIG